MKRIKLEDIERKQPYQVPPEYFEQLPMRVQSHIHTHQHENDHRFTISWSWRRTALTGLAASVVAVLIWVTYPEKQTSLGEETLSHVTEVEIIDYLKESQISQSEVKELSPIADEAAEDEMLLQQLNLDEDDLREAIINQDVQENI